MREPPCAIATNTRDALRVGVLTALRRMSEGIVADIEKELGVKRLSVVITGGDAPLVGKDLRLVHHPAPMLTLLGLNIIAQRIEHEQNRPRL
jgi:pantothenate kinase type III